MQNICILPLAIIFAGQIAAIQDSAEFSGTVIGVSDGDTIAVLCDGKPVKVRLSAVDAPEKKQPFGQAAKQFTSGLVFGKTVTVLRKSKDRYGRVIGEVTLSDGRNVSDELLAGGYAWWYQQYSKETQRGELETAARQRRLGLWSDPRALSPWTYRKRKSKNQSL